MGCLPALKEIVYIENRSSWGKSVRPQCDLMQGMKTNTILASWMAQI